MNLGIITIYGTRAIGIKMTMMKLPTRLQINALFHETKQKNK